MPVGWERQRVALQKERRLIGMRLTCLTSFPVSPGSSLQDLCIFQLRFCSFFSFLFPSKLKNSLAIRIKKHCRLQIFRCTRSYLSKSNAIKSYGPLALVRCFLSLSELTELTDLHTASFLELEYLWCMLKGWERVETWDHCFWGPTNCSLPANIGYF